ncbi:MAG TPA: translation initiation factor IF-5A [Candidatus Nanoarchaeia archaeon]|nr:translation initiation factor IF-5A [Candidatus Nanoarchaeia archaeon]
MAEIRQTQAGNLKVGSYVLMNGAPCVVKNIQISKTGKHGSSKCRIEAVGIIDSQKRIELHPSGDNMEVPIIEKKSAQVLSVHENVANVMDAETYETFDLVVSEELKGSVEEGAHVSYWIVMDQKILKGK